MNKFAVIETGGKQYKVYEGDEINVELLKDKQEKDKISFDKIVILDDGLNTELGNPYLKNRSVDGEIVSVFRDKKVRVIKFKNKNNYRRHNGHRQTLTKVRINTIK